jgi:hypothetical protein
MKRIKIVGPREQTVRSTTPTAKAIDPEVLAQSLGAHYVGSVDGDGSSLSNPAFAGLRRRLLSALRSTGGRPGLAGTERRQKIPMTDRDWKQLEDLAALLCSDGFAPTPGQVAGQLLHDAIEQVKQSRPAGSPRLTVTGVSDVERARYSPAVPKHRLPEPVRLAQRQHLERAQAGLERDAA